MWIIWRMSKYSLEIVYIRGFRFVFVIFIVSCDSRMEGYVEIGLFLFGFLGKVRFVV